MLSNARAQVRRPAPERLWLYDGQFNYVFRQAPQILCSLFNIGIAFIG